MAAFHYGPHNPNITEGWDVREDPDDGLFYVMVPEKIMCDCGCPNCNTVLEIEYHKHTSHGPNFPGLPDPDELYEWMSSVQERYDESFDRHLEENSYEIAQQERWEAFRNEY